jgi:serine-protein kinase ATM
MATARDVRDVLSKLSSDKARSREEGVKSLSAWLGGDSSAAFSRLLARNTLRPADTDTWPHLITLLSRCVALEIAASKKRPPKPLYAKTLRMAVLSALDPKLSLSRLSQSQSQSSLLLSIAKPLFNHILEVTKDAPTFLSDYATILRSLFLLRHYRYQIRPKTYNSLLLLFFHKALSAVNPKSNTQSVSREDFFRSLLTLHVLLQNPPADFTDATRNHIISAFSDIFLQLRSLL